MQKEFRFNDLAIFHYRRFVIIIKTKYMNNRRFTKKIQFFLSAFSLIIIKLFHHSDDYSVKYYKSGNKERKRRDFMMTL